MEEFKSYKEKQRYYEERHKNRGKVVFSQNSSAQIFANGQVGTLKKQKGKTYVKVDK